MGRSIEVFGELVRYQTELWYEIDGRVRAAHDLPLERFEVMRAIHEAGGSCRVNDIAQSLAITGGAASKLVDRLERSGLAERRPNPVDRRSALVSLTADGALRFDEALVTFESELDLLVGDVLSSAERRNLLDVLGRLKAAFGARRASVALAASA
jgi:DNA-binding MarR family transcriptional regulator